MTSGLVHTILAFCGRSHTHNNCWGSRERSRVREKGATHRHMRRCCDSLVGVPTRKIYLYSKLFFMQFYAGCSKWKEMKFEFSLLFARSALSISLLACLCWSYICFLQRAQSITDEERHRARKELEFHRSSELKETEKLLFSFQKSREWVKFDRAEESFDRCFFFFWRFCLVFQFFFNSRCHISFLLSLRWILRLLGSVVPEFVSLTLFGAIKYALELTRVFTGDPKCSAWNV